MASQMTAARFDTLAYQIDAAGYTFKASGSRMTFKGYTAVYKEAAPEEEEQNVSLPLLEKGEELEAKTYKQNNSWCYTNLRPIPSNQEYDGHDDLRFLF